MCQKLHPILGKLLCCISFCLPLLMAQTLWAQDESESSSVVTAGTTVWLIDPSSADSGSRGALRQSLEQALKGASGTHVIGAEAFEALISKKRPEAPKCLWGEGVCESPDALVLDALDVGLIVRLRARRDGKSFEAAYALIDRRGRPDSEPTVRSTSWQDLGFAIVRQLYKSTGTVAFDSTPQGATVFVDGAPVGKTPMEYRLPIGRHGYKMALERYSELEGEVVVSAGSKDAQNVRVNLEAKLGTVSFLDAAPGAQVFIEGMNQPFDPLAPVELEPGNYTYEIRAEGYETVRGGVELEPGMNVQRSAATKAMSPIFRDITASEIAFNHYMVQLSYAHTFQTTSFRGARTSDRGELFFKKFSDDGESTDPGRFFDTNGLRLDLSYGLENFVLTFLTISYLTDHERHKAILEDDEDNLKNVEFLQVSRLQLQPFQVHYRYIYKNIVPTVGLGLGVNFQWISVKEEGDDDADAFSLSQTEAFWTVELGLNYFVTPNWFASLRYNFHDHFNVGVGTEHMISFGVGGAFANILGMEPEPPSLLGGGEE